jgi:hypothetical protein
VPTVVRAVPGGWSRTLESGAFQSGIPLHYVRTMESTYALVLITVPIPFFALAVHFYVRCRRKNTVLRAVSRSEKGSRLTVKQVLDLNIATQLDELQDHQCKWSALA